MFNKIFTFLIFAILIHPKETNFKINHISIENGLSQSSVYTMIQDHNGFMWFGTGDGLNRYDGYEIIVYKNKSNNFYSISNNSIRCLCEDHSGNIWIGTDNGINKFDPQTNKFYNRMNSPDNEVFKLLTNYSINNLTVDSNNLLWFSFQNYIFSYNLIQNKINKYALSNSGSIIINDLFIDPDGKVWASIKDKLFNFDRSQNKFIQFYLSNKKNISSINYIFNDDQNNICLLNANKSIIKINRVNSSIININLNNLDHEFTRNDFVKDICEWKKNHFLITISDRGLFDLNISNGNVNYIDFNKNELSSLNFNSIYDIYRDHSKLFWLGTDEGIDIINFNKPKFKHIILNSSSKKFSRGNYIKSIYKDSENNLWIGTYDYGLNKSKEYSGNVITYNVKNTSWIKSNSFYCAYEDKNKTIWFGSNNYLYKKTKLAEKFSSIKINGTINCITEYPKGFLWIGTSTGLYKFNILENKFVTNREDQNKPINYYPLNIWAIYVAKSGYIFLGTYGNGLVIYNTLKNSLTKFVNNQIGLNEISDNNVKVIYPDPEQQDIYWIGTSNGLNKFNFKTSEFVNYFEKDGLPNDYIYGILSDNQNNLWISTNRGLSKLNLKAMLFRNYSVEDGLQSYEFNSGAYFKDKDGYLYFGGINGYNVFYPDSVIDNPFVPKIMLTNIKKNNENYVLPNDPSRVNEINLNYNENTISLEFAALEYTNSLENKYKIKLEGFDKDWIYIGTKRQARYTNLNPGNYTFMVKASNNDGVWNPIPLKLNINIIPPIWKRLWFRISSIMLLLTLFVITIRLFEIRRYKRKLILFEQQAALNKERIRISNDMHDDVGSVLTKMSLQMSSLLKSKTFADQEISLINKISESNKEVVQKIDEIVWAINPKNDNLKNLTAYLSEYAEDFFESSDISCRYDFPLEITPYILSSEVRHNIFLVFKEILNNIIKHSGADKVFIKLSEGKNEFNLLIQDNGKGIDNTEIEVNGNGLANMKDRIEKIGGKFYIDSSSESGTKITISIILEN